MIQVHKLEAGSRHDLHVGISPDAPDEVHRVTRDSDRELRIFVRVLDRVLERLLVDHVQVHVEAAAIEIDVEGLDRFIQQLALRQVRLLRRDGDGVADAIQ